MMCLAIYAVKCDVPKAKLKEDIRTAFEELRGVEHDNPLTEDDIKSAMEAYDREFYNFTIADIEKLTDVRIERNKRNGRKQPDHIRRITLLRDADYPEGAWRNKNGRPAGSGTAEQKVAAYRAEHPEASVTEVARELGISRTTAYKWWDAELDEGFVFDEEPEEFYDDDFGDLSADLDALAALGILK